MIKVCNRCGKKLGIEHFYTSRHTPDGVRRECKKCGYEYNKRYREYRRKYLLKYYRSEKYQNYLRKFRTSDKYKKYQELRKTPEFAAHRRNLAKTPEARKQKSEYLKKRKATNLHYKLTALLRNRLYQALKKNHKVGSAVKDLGCSVPELKIYLEKQFKTGMTWQNWTHTGWHIDHIKPLISFDLTKRDEFLRACHYTNLQPLWAKDNLRKDRK